MNFINYFIVIIIDFCFVGSDFSLVNLSMFFMLNWNNEVIRNIADYYLTKIDYGDTAGFRPTDLTYAGDLIANVGESITSVLDKIKNMLVEFEYFYDVEGRFVF